MCFFVCFVLFLFLCFLFYNVFFVSFVLFLFCLLACLFVCFFGFIHLKQNKTFVFRKTIDCNPVNQFLSMKFKITPPYHTANLPDMQVPLR